MKKIIIIIILLFILLLTGSTPKEEVRGVFISYIEEKRYLSNNQTNNIKEMVSNIKKNNYNLIILQVRSNADSIYNSKYYPKVDYINDLDILDLFIKEAHNNNLKIYAWINPYRISTSNDISIIKENNPAYKYIDTDYIYINNGIYFNPSKQEVEDLIINGVEEIIENYEVDGILYDDYFYPSDDIDILDYNKYIQDNGFIESNEYHLNIINKMIKRTHDICTKKNIVFGVSPDGNINNNYEYLYADIYKWIDEEYIDFIMPQVYYGLFNEKMPFYNTIKEWNEITKNKTKLYIALSLYKSGNIDKYAKSGIEEWINNKDIIKREVILSRNLSNYSGFSIFRYDHLFTEEIQNNNVKEEVNNLHKILN